MAYLVAAVVLVGVLCALNLLLVVGVIRRLREHAQLLGRLMDARPPEDRSPKRGTTVPAFTAVTVDGPEVSRDTFAGAPFVMAFLSAGCHPCLDQLPEFERYAREAPGGRDSVLAVVADTSGPDATADGTAEFVERLRPVAHVVTEPEPGPLGETFSITVWPVFLLMDEQGVVSAAGQAARDLPQSWVSSSGVPSS